MLTLTPQFYDPTGPARYIQLSQAIADAIRDGHLEPGEILPTEQAICDAAGVAKSVVRQAFAELEAAGQIERRSNKPARVTPAGKVRVLSMQRYLDEDRRLHDGEHPAISAFTQGHDIAWADYRIDLTIAAEKATPRDRQLLRLGARAGVWRRSFVKYAGPDQPVEIQRSAFPAWVVKGHGFLIDPSEQPAPGGVQRELYRAGLRVAFVRHSTRARMASKDEGRILRITRAPVLDCERVMYDADYRPVESSRLVLPAARHVLVDEVEIAPLSVEGFALYHADRVAREGS